MALLRLVAILAAGFIAICALLYMVTGERRYLELAKRSIKYALWAALAVCGLIFLPLP